MRDLVALDLPGGRGFVEALSAVWDTGDAAAPLDRRLPPAAARAQLAALRPTRVVGPDGAITRLDGGLPVEDGDALVVATSGTTGEPRGVVLTHAALEAGARATSSRLGIEPARTHWLACLPLAHIGGLSVVARALLTGTALTVLPAFDPDAVMGSGATHTSLVPTALRRIDPGAFERILLGGAAPPPVVPPNAVVTYGLTETGSGIVYDGVPLDGVEVAVADGEIRVRGPMLLRAYRDGTDPTRDGGWLPTGDGGLIGDDGRLVVHGRLAEVVNTGGEKVWPVAVERRLSEHPAVGEAAVWKRPDPEWGERVVAWVVAADPSRPPVLAELAAWVSVELPPWAAPKELVLVADLPRTPSGKVRRRALE